jgi:hypothetical protein
VKVLRTIRVIKEGNLRIRVVKEGNLRIRVVKEGNLRIRVEKRNKKVEGHNAVHHYLRLSNDAGRQRKEYLAGRQKPSWEKRLFREKLLR